MFPPRSVSPTAMTSTTDADAHTPSGASAPSVSEPALSSEESGKNDCLTAESGVDNGRSDSGAAKGDDAVVAAIPSAESTVTTVPGCEVPDEEKPTFGFSRFANEADVREAIEKVQPRLPCVLMCFDCFCGVLSVGCASDVPNAAFLHGTTPGCKSHLLHIGHCRGCCLKQSRDLDTWYCVGRALRRRCSGCCLCLPRPIAALATCKA